MEATDLICFRCRHFNRVGGGCAAFPDGIPDEITDGEHPHNRPLPGQGNDIVFEEESISITEKIVFPICFDCKHYNGGATYTCKAFADKIPDAILLGKKKHNKPLPGQGNDIVYEPIE